MFGGKKIAISGELYERIKKVVEAAGYSSIDEFIAHALENELARLEGPESEDEIKAKLKLKGLGYIS